MKEVQDTYQTIAAPAEGEYKEKGSKFLCYLKPVDKKEELEHFIEKVKSDHPKARHHCYAYRLGLEGEKFRFNDDGEPSGTAGRPILSQLKSFEVTNIIAIVVRYFGGTKLGASGLVNAYKESTRHALIRAKLVIKTLEQKFSLQCKYEDLPILLEAVKFANVTIVEKHFEKVPELIVSIPLSKKQQSWNIIATKFIGHNAGLKDLKDRQIKIKELEVS